MIVNGKEHIAESTETQNQFDDEHWIFIIKALQMEFGDKAYAPKTAERTIASSIETKECGQDKPDNKRKAGAKASAKKRAVSSDAPTVACSMRRARD